MAELLALVDVRDVDLDHGRIDGPDAIGQSNARVGVGTGIQHDAIDVESHLLQLVDECAFVVALEIANLGHALELGAQTVHALFHGLPAVDVGFAPPQQIQVWPVDNHDFLHRRFR